MYSVVCDVIVYISNLSLKKKNFFLFRNQISTFEMHCRRMGNKMNRWIQKSEINHKIYKMKLCKLLALNHFNNSQRLSPGQCVQPSTRVSKTRNKD